MRKRCFFEKKKHKTFVNSGPGLSRYQTERFNSEPRCAGLVGSRLGEDNVGEGVNGASPLGFCGVSRSPDRLELVEEAAGRENAVSEEPVIMASIISSIG